MFCSWVHMKPCMKQKSPPPPEKCVFLLFCCITWTPTIVLPGTVCLRPSFNPLHTKMYVLIALPPIWLADSLFLSPWPHFPLVFTSSSLHCTLLYRFMLDVWFGYNDSLGRNHPPNELLLVFWIHIVESKAHKICKLQKLRIKGIF